jgi:hypothetical protein
MVTTILNLKRKYFAEFILGKTLGPIVNSKIILKVEICFKSKKATHVLQLKIGGVMRLGFDNFFYS